MRRILGALARSIALAAALVACARQSSLPPSAPAGTTSKAGSQVNLFVENYDDIVEYTLDGQRIKTITHGIPKEGVVGGLAFDSKGKLYAVTGSFNISIYAPATRKLVGKITQGLDETLAIAIDRSDNLYAASGIKESVSVYPYGQRTPARVITQGLNDPVALAFDSKGNLYVANLFGSSVTVYSPDGTLLRTVKTPGPEAIALDEKDRLYVANGAAGYGKTVSVYDSSGKLLAAFTSGKAPSTIAVAGSRYFYVGNVNSNTATIYSIHRWKFLYKIRHVRLPWFVLADSEENLYLVGYGKNNDAYVNVYRPGKTKPFRTITDGVTGVRAIAFGPP